MMRRAAAVMGRRPPTIVKLPVLTPRLSSYWDTLAFEDAVRAALP